MNIKSIISNRVKVTVGDNISSIAFGQTIINQGQEKYVFRTREVEELIKDGKLKAIQ